jgi:site-specific DNA-methyltransferase (adenine-specific)
MTVQLMQGDCLVRMAEIPDGSVDMILADLPYGTTACKWDNVIPFEPLWQHYWRVLKPNGAVVLFGSEPFSSHLRMSQIKHYKYDWVWFKNRGSNFATVKYQPMKEHELVSIFGKGKTKYYPQMQARSENGQKMVKSAITFKGKLNTVYGNANSKGGSKGHLDLTWRNPSSVQKFNCQVGHHPTQKPVALLEYLIRTYTLESETVLDNTMGSGSTGVAAVNLKRKFIGIEQDDKYFAIAQKRIADAQTPKELWS